jgi:hypothetical protein
VLQSSLAAQYRVPSIHGYQEVVSFLERVAPEEPVFYDGRYDGVFTFYVRAGDEEFQRRVVLGHKLLYTCAVFVGWRQKEFVGSPEEVIDVLRRRGGCRWLALETGGVHPCAAVDYLHQAVKTPAFELVRSFPIEAPRIDRVDVYRLRGPVANVETVDLPFPILGPDVTYRVRPIPARHSRQAKGR